MKVIEKTITSLEVAEMVQRQHKEVLRDIRRIIDQLAERKNALSDYFIESTYGDVTNRELPCFHLSKKGCELYSTRMTGAKGTRFAVAYIDRFNEMENHIKTVLPDKNDPMAILELTFQAQKNTNERVTTLESAVKEIADNKLITTEDKSSIDRRLRRKVAGICREQHLDREAKSLLFADIGRSLKEVFNVPHRGRIKDKDFQAAIEFIDLWEPSSVTKTKIKQLKLEI